MSIREFRGAAVATVLFGAAAGYLAAVPGGPVRALESEFDVSLTAIGLLTSTFFVGVAAFSLGAPFFVRVAGFRGSLLIASGLMGAGAVVSTVAGAFWLMIAGRVVAGLGVGLTLVLAAHLGRAVGGATLVGIYGGAVTVAAGAALALGGVLQSAGVDWRVDFAIAAAFGFSPFPFVLGRLPEVMPTRGRLGSALIRMFLSWSYWPVALLFMFAAGLPLVVSAWIVHYLTADDAMSAGAAGALGFFLFAVSTVGRPLSGRVDERHHPLILLASPFVATAGFVLLAVDNAPALAIPAIAAIGIGMATPYAVSYIRSEDLVHDQATVGLAAGLLAVNLAPILFAPAVGATFEHGHAAIGWLGLAAVCVIAGVANLPRPTMR